MRERQLFDSIRTEANRITPAYAGKTQAHQVYQEHSRDHPRVCGKDCIAMGIFYATQGSPPRMRERLFNSLSTRLKRRITPAYAGKTWLVFSGWACLWDHPRVCGKDCSSSSASLRALGSPPRMRERPLSKSALNVSPRITPAYAGKTKIVKLFTAIIQDHPRVCGKDLC